MRRRISNSGYKQFWDDEAGRWEYTHRRVAEKKLGGRIWRGHEVHHRNRDRYDNRPSNLVVLSKRAHRRVHKLDDLHEKAEYVSLLGRIWIWFRVRRLARKVDKIENGW